MKHVEDGMFGVGLWLFVCVVWGLVAWLFGVGMALVAFPYWFVPLLLVSYLVGVEFVDRFAKRMKALQERPVAAPQRRDPMAWMIDDFGSRQQSANH